jgi:uncharacterized protein (TIGR02145 family)
MVACGISAFFMQAKAQSPNAISFQGILKKANGSALSMKLVKVKTSILQSSPSGTTTYAETQSVTTSKEGVFALQIGKGTPSTGDFGSIKWGSNNWYVKTEVDTTNAGTSYFDFGTQQLLSVPYALHAQQSASIQIMSTTDRQALTDLKPGLMILNSTTNTIDVYNGIEWVSFYSSYKAPTASPGPIGIDQNGMNFKTVQIGNQLWMAENLKTNKYRNGDPIPMVSDVAAWSNQTAGASCFYNNDSSQLNRGLLYNWYTTIDSRNVCPTGWHVPSDAEWTTLVNYLGGNSTAGTKLKEFQLNTWQGTSPGDNSSGFSGISVGIRSGGGQFSQQGMLTDWWTMTEISGTPTKAYSYEVSNNGTNATRAQSFKSMGISIRCIHD